MRPITMLQAQFKADTQSGEGLCFEACKGGYFSTKEEYGLKVVGKTLQEGSPTPDNPIPIQCVREGTKIICGDNYIILPCDLYEGDIWYPASGKVERHSYIGELVETNDIYFSMNETFNDVINIRFYCYHVKNGAPYHSLNNNKVYCNYLYDDYKKNGAIWLHSSAKSVMWCWFSYEDLGIEYSENGSGTAAALKDFCAAREAEGNPVMMQYIREVPVLEQYEPQPIAAPQGTVIVTQEPTELSANLEATMLVRR